MSAKLKVNGHKPFEDPERAEVEAKVINMVENDSENALNKNLTDGDYQEESQSLAIEKQRVKDLLASERHKNFIKGLNEISAVLNNNPKAQMEHAKTL